MSKRCINENINKLKSNSYPGRGIIIGMSPDSKKLIQVYWIMGRSDNSRNRIFEEDAGFVRTRAYDASKVVDPSLIIYYPAKHTENCHIITNGDQTETIYNVLKSGGNFSEALDTRCFEPDAPNFTPRISGLVDLKDPKYAYRLSILKSSGNEGASSIRNYFNYEKGIPGVGHCIHTYSQDGNPLPSFEGEPYELELFDEPAETANYYWDALNEENRISLLVKYIYIEKGSFELKIINKRT